MLYCCIIVPAILNYTEFESREMRRRLPLRDAYRKIVFELLGIERRGNRKLCTHTHKRKSIYSTAKSKWHRIENGKTAPNTVRSRQQTAETQTHTHPDVYLFSSSLFSSFLSRITFHTYLFVRLLLLLLLWASFCFMATAAAAAVANKAILLKNHSTHKGRP